MNMPRSRASKIGRERALAFLRRSFSTSLFRARKGFRMYRGRWNYKPGLFLSRPSKRTRFSKTNSGIYNIMMDFWLPSWQNYPKRTRSLICGTNANDITDYGNVHLVLPRNGAKIGICPMNDLWVSFNNVEERWGAETMEDFDDDMKKLLDAASKNTVELSNDYIKGYLKRFEDLDKIPESTQRVIAYFTSDYREYISQDITDNKKGTWKQYFDELMNPKKNGFQLKTIETYNLKYSDNKEIWTDADSILFNTNIDEYDFAMDEIEGFLDTIKWKGVQ